MQSGDVSWRRLAALATAPPHVLDDIQAPQLLAAFVDHSEPVSLAQSSSSVRRRLWLLMSRTDSSWQSAARLFAHMAPPAVNAAESDAMLRHVSRVAAWNATLRCFSFVPPRHRQRADVAKVVADSLRRHKPKNWVLRTAQLFDPAARGDATASRYSSATARVVAARDMRDIAVAVRDEPPHRWNVARDDEGDATVRAATAAVAALTDTAVEREVSAACAAIRAIGFDRAMTTVDERQFRVLLRVATRGAAWHEVLRAATLRPQWCAGIPTTITFAESKAASAKWHRAAKFLLRNAASVQPPDFARAVTQVPAWDIALGLFSVAVAAAGRTPRVVMQMRRTAGRVAAADPSCFWVAALSIATGHGEAHFTKAMTVLRRAPTDALRFALPPLLSHIRPSQTHLLGAAVTSVERGEWAIALAVLRASHHVGLSARVSPVVGRIAPVEAEYLSAVTGARATMLRFASSQAPLLCELLFPRGGGADWRAALRAAAELRSSGHAALTVDAVLLLQLFEALHTPILGASLPLRLLPRDDVTACLVSIVTGTSVAHFREQHASALCDASTLIGAAISKRASQRVLGLPSTAGAELLSEDGWRRLLTSQLTAAERRSLHDALRRHPPTFRRADTLEAFVTSQCRVATDSDDVLRATADLFAAGAIGPTVRQRDGSDVITGPLIASLLVSHTPCSRLRPVTAVLCTAVRQRGGPIADRAEYNVAVARARLGSWRIALRTLGLRQWTPDESRDAIFTAAHVPAAALRRALLAHLGWPMGVPKGACAPDDRQLNTAVALAASSALPGWVAAPGTQQRLWPDAWQRVVAAMDTWRNAVAALSCAPQLHLSNAVVQGLLRAPTPMLAAVARHCDTPAHYVLHRFAAAVRSGDVSTACSTAFDMCRRRQLPAAAVRSLAVALAASGTPAPSAVSTKDCVILMRKVHRHRFDALSREALRNEAPPPLPLADAFPQYDRLRFTQGRAYAALLALHLCDIDGARVHRSTVRNIAALLIAASSSHWQLGLVLLHRFQGVTLRDASTAIAACRAGGWRAVVDVMTARAVRRVIPRSSWFEALLLAAPHTAGMLLRLPRCDTTCWTAALQLLDDDRAINDDLLMRLAASPLRPQRCVDALGAGLANGCENFTSEGLVPVATKLRRMGHWVVAWRLLQTPLVAYRHDDVYHLLVHTVARHRPQLVPRLRANVQHAHLLRDDTRRLLGL
jgi:hypothetical protein